MCLCFARAKSSVSLAVFCFGKNVEVAQSPEVAEQWIKWLMSKKGYV